MVARLLDSIDLDAIGAIGHMRMTGVECTRRAMLLLLIERIDCGSASLFSAKHVGVSSCTVSREFLRIH